MERIGKHPRLATLAASMLVIGVLFLAKGVLIPFALAILVSFLLAPLVLRLQRWHCSRVVAVVTALLLVFIASSAASWLVVEQVREVTASLSEYRLNIQDKIATLRGAVAKPLQTALKTVMALGAELAPVVESRAEAPTIQTVNVAAPARGPFEVLRDALAPTIDVLMTAAMALLFAFMMLLRRDDLGDRLIRMVGHGNVLVTTRALEEASRKVSSYLWRLLLLNGLHGMVVGIGLTCIGVPNALLWGLLAALLRFIPYVGPLIAATFPVLAALATSPGWSQPLLAVGLFVLLELISNNLLEPWIYGTGTGISPLAILASTLFWTWIWGPVGLVLSTPLTVCLVVMAKYVPQLQFLHFLFGNAPGLSPPERLYQRLIAGDQDQAWLVLRPELDQKALHEVYDSVVLPALSMAEYDRQRGALDEEADTRIEEAMKLLIEEAGELRPGSDVRSHSAEGPELGGSLRVLILPARGTADALAASMLRQVLEHDGAQVEVSSIASVSGESLDLLDGAVDIVCISAMPPSQIMHVRYLCKRIAGRLPGLPIVAGLWTLEPETRSTPDRLPMLASVHVVASLGEARIQVRQLAEARRTRHEAGLALAVGGLRQETASRSRS